MSGYRLFDWWVVVNDDTGLIVATSAYEYWATKAAREFKAHNGDRCAPLSVHKIRRARRPKVGAAFQWKEWR